MSDTPETDKKEPHIPQDSTLANERELREEREEHIREEAPESLADARAEAEQAAEEKAEKREREGRSVLPKPTFSTFVLSLASSALVQLGEVADPESGKMAQDQAMAKHSIDILAMLQDKTTNGLDKDESRLLDGLLYELRMKYVLKK
jgi:hypothetical protein